MPNFHLIQIETVMKGAYISLISEVRETGY
jgi:hypothetical protein